MTTEELVARAKELAPLAHPKRSGSTDALVERERVILNLCIVSGGQSEAARLLGCTKQAVQAILSRARQAGRLSPEEVVQTYRPMERRPFRVKRPAPEVMRAQVREQTINEYIELSLQQERLPNSHDLQRVLGRRGLDSRIFRYWDTREQFFDDVLTKMPSLATLPYNAHHHEYPNYLLYRERKEYLRSLSPEARKQETLVRQRDWVRNRKRMNEGTAA